MRSAVGRWQVLSAATLLLCGCVAGGAPDGAPHLSAVQCRDLTALRNNAPPTQERSSSELAALRAAGYDPSRWFDPHYPDDLQAAQTTVDQWFQADCLRTPAGS